MTDRAELERRLAEAVQSYESEIEAGTRRLFGNESRVEAARVSLLGAALALADALRDEHD